MVMPAAGTCDPRQTCQRTRLSERLLGALTTKAKPVSLEKQREMLPKEMLWVMGVPVFKHLLPEHVQVFCDFPFLYAFETLRDSEIVQLAGNTMSLPVIGISLGFCLAHIKVLDGQRLNMTAVWHDS